MICPVCGREGESLMPLRTGDLTICFACQGLLVATDDAGGRRPATEEEAASPNATRKVATAKFLRRFLPVPTDD